MANISIMDSSDSYENFYAIYSNYRCYCYLLKTMDNLPFVIGLQKCLHREQNFHHNDQLKYGEMNGHVARTRNRINAYRVPVKKPEGKRTLGVLDVNRTIILKWI